MKKQRLYIVALAVAGLIGRANAQCDWTSVGPSDTNRIAFGEASYESVAVDPTTNDVYVAYRDGGNYYSASVSKFSATTGQWSQVGMAGFPYSECYYESIAIDKKGTPYVACEDKGVSDFCRVYKYDGSTNQWDTLSGEAAGLNHVAQYISMATDTNGIPYVAYEDVQKQYKCDVMMYDTLNKVWTPLGGLGISGGQAQYTCMAFDKVHNIPYVAYEDGAHGDKLMVLSWNGTSWSPVGGVADSAGITTDTVGFISLTTDKNGNPYVSYEDYSNSKGLSVMMFNGTSWSAVGNASATTSGPVNYTSIGVDTSDNVYVAYQDLSKYGYSALSMVKYSGSAWAYVGGTYKISQAISAGNALYVALAVDNGTPVVAYEDKGVGNHAEAFAYNSTSSYWQMLGGTGLSNLSGSGWNGLASYNSIAISSTGTPYVAYRDGNNGGKATVMSYNGTTWSPVGTAGISKGAIRFTNIGFDAAGDPICMFSDKSASPSYGVSAMIYKSGAWTAIGTNAATISGGNAYDVSMAIANDTVFAVYETANYHMAVMECPVNGTTWANVGPADITGDTATYESIAIDKNGVPYIAFEDAPSYALGITVMKYSGGSWNYVGSRNISAGEGVHACIQIDPKDNMPVVAYSSWASSTEANVEKFDGTNWNYIGKPGFSTDWTGYIYLSIDSKGAYYASYQDYGIQVQGQGQYNCTVEKFDPITDTAWRVMPIGGGSASQAGSEYDASAIDPSTGTLYVTYSAYSAFVKKLGCPMSVNEINGNNKAQASVYPDPNHGSFTVELQNTTAKSYVSIFNVLGENVYQAKLTSGKTQVNLNNAAPGIYLYRILAENGQVISTGKLIVQ